jgi:hypothetical protein
MSAFPATVRGTRSLGDRFAEISVPIVTALALLLGWGLKASVEARAVPFQAEGISAQVPAGWLRATGGENETLRVTDPASTGFATFYTIETRPVAAGTSAAQFTSLLTLARGQSLTAYRVLDQQPFDLNGRSGYKLTFAYVESNPDLTHTELPHVVRGVEYIFIDGERAVLVAYHAEEAAYEPDFPRFRRFLDSVSF